MKNTDQEKVKKKQKRESIFSFGRFLFLMFGFL